MFANTCTQNESASNGNRELEMSPSPEANITSQATAESRATKPVLKQGSTGADAVKGCQHCVFQEENGSVSALTLQGEHPVTVVRGSPSLLERVGRETLSRLTKSVLVKMGCSLAFFSGLALSSLAAPQTISQLPDGNYRYSAAKFSSPIVSDEELVKAGGYYFLFRKRGEQVTGIFWLVDSGEIICLNGNVNGNTVTGAAVQVSEPPHNAQNVLSGSTGETFVKWSRDGSLKVRRGSQTGNIIRYRSSLLDLNGFNRINAGTQIPVKRCP